MGTCTHLNITHNVLWITILPDTVYAEIFTRRKFHQFRHLLSLAKFYHVNFLSCVNDYIEDMATFTTLAKFIPPNISAIQRYLGLAKFLSSENFHIHGNSMQQTKIVHIIGILV